MAQIVGYWDDFPDLVITDGPFVLCNACGSGYRIEVDEGGKCPRAPHYKLYDVLERHGLRAHKSLDRDLMEKSVDWLNVQVKAGKIVKGSDSVHVWLES